VTVESATVDGATAVTLATVATVVTLATVVTVDGALALWGQAWGEARACLHTYPAEA